MENPKATTIKQVQATFAAWKAVQDKIKVLEQALPANVSRRDAPLVEMQSELKALHAEAERLLLIAQHALLAIKTPRSSNGDSTWGQ